MSRDIWVTEGEVEFVRGRVTEREQRSLDTATFSVGLGEKSDPPATWKAADLVERNLPHQVDVAMLVGSDATPGKGQWLWVRITDGAEVLMVRADGDYVNVL